MRLLTTAALVAACALPAPLFAQTVPSAGTGEPSAYDGDFLVVGIGVAAVPSYEGSDETSIIPAAGVAGRVRGIGISPRVAGAALNFIPAPNDARVTFQLGPVARYRDNRASHIKDPVVARLGKLKGTIEAGVATGVTVNRVLNAYDSLNMGVDVRWDTSGHGGARVISVGGTYLTPVSHAQVVGLAGSVNFVNDAWANYNYSVSPAGSVASGLPVYNAKGGMKDWGLRAFTAYDLDGNLLDGGFAILAGVGYSRLTGSAAQSPIVSLRGSRDQWMGGVGLTYTF